MKCVPIMFQWSLTITYHLHVMSRYVCAHDGGTAHIIDILIQNA